MGAKEAAKKQTKKNKECPLCRQPNRPWVFGRGGGRGRVREVAGGEVTAGPRSKATAAVVDGFGECWREGMDARSDALRCLCDAMRSVMQ